MRSLSHASARQTGASMMEILVTLVILLIGLLGLAGLMVQSQRAETESYQRAQALILMQDMAGRINTNRAAANCYAFTTDTANGLPYLGTGAASPPACGIGTVQAYTLANNDLNAWNQLLLGSTESQGSNNIGGLIGARGCVSYNATSGVYLISVAWQGLGKTLAPVASLTCGKGLYGDEAMRRVVSMTLQIAKLQ